MLTRLDIKVKGFSDRGLVISGLASTSTRDSDGEMIYFTKEAIENAFKEAGNQIPFKFNHAFFFDKATGQFAGSAFTEDIFDPQLHQWQYPDFGNRDLGVVTSLDYKGDLDLNKPKLEDIEISFTGIITDKLLIETILNNEANEVSLGWIVRRKYIVKEDNQPTGEEIALQIELSELSVTPQASNPDTKLTIVTDQKLIEQYGFSPELVVLNEKAKVKSLYTDQKQNFFEVEFPDKKIKALIPESKFKAYTAQIDETGLDKIIKNGLRKKIKKENYDIANNELVDFSYSFPKTQLIFGKAGKRHSTDFSINSSGQITFYNKISNSEKAESKSQSFTDYPQKATENAQKVLDWKEKYKDEVTAMTKVGWARANQLAKREAISLDVVKRMAQFNRHRQNSKVGSENKNTPWKDNGYVAWLGWGGDEGVDWAIQKLENLETKRAREGSKLKKQKAVTAKTNSITHSNTIKFKKPIMDQKLINNVVSILAENLPDSQDKPTDFEVVEKELSLTEGKIYCVYFSFANAKHEVRFNENGEVISDIITLEEVSADDEAGDDEANDDDSSNLEVTEELKAYISKEIKAMAKELKSEMSKTLNGMGKVKGKKDMEDGDSPFLTNFFN